MHRFQFCQEYSGQIADFGGMQEILLHKYLNSAATTFVLVTHGFGHSILHIERQLLRRPITQQMKVTASGPKKIFSRSEIRELFICKNTDGHQIGCVLYTVNVFADPKQRLQIAQPAFAFFYVRFNNIALALFDMACISFR